MLLRQEQYVDVDLRSAVGLKAQTFSQSWLPALEGGQQGANIVTLVPRHGAHVHVLSLARRTIRGV